MRGSAVRSSRWTERLVQVASAETPGGPQHGGDHLRGDRPRPRQPLLGEAPGLGDELRVLASPGDELDGLRPGELHLLVLGGLGAEAERPGVGAEHPPHPPGVGRPESPGEEVLPDGGQLDRRLETWCSRAPACRAASCSPSARGTAPPRTSASVSPSSPTHSAASSWPARTSRAATPGRAGDGSSRRTRRWGAPSPGRRAPRASAPPWEHRGACTGSAPSPSCSSGRRPESARPRRDLPVEPAGSHRSWASCRTAPWAAAAHGGLHPRHARADRGRCRTPAPRLRPRLGDGARKSLAVALPSACARR